MSRADEPVIDNASLRSAIEFAVLVAEETQKRKPPMAVPSQIKAFFGKPRIPSGALGRLRRTIEADPVFRGRLAAGAVPELVDEVGRLWLQQPAGWETDAAALVAESAQRGAEADAALLLGRADKRRRAAEEVAGRARAEAIRLEAVLHDRQLEIDRLRADLVKADDTVAETRAELLDVRNEARHARDRESAAAAKLAKVVAERDDARSRAQPGPSEPGAPSSADAPNASRRADGRADGRPESRADGRPESRADGRPESRAKNRADGLAGGRPGFTVVADDALRALVESATMAAESAATASQLAQDALAVVRGALPDESVGSGGSVGSVGPVGPGGSGLKEGASVPLRARRRALTLPGGVIATSAEAAGHLVRSDASVLIDGYNVAMLARPRIALSEQRAWLIDAVENVVRRFGTDATIVFDGADVVGSHTATRRSTRIVYSPAGVIADDVIRDEIDRLPIGRHVVVVTNDAELARDSRARGANVLPSNALVALL